MANSVHRLINSIDARSWEILELRWGIGASATLSELGDAYGISRERVRQIESKSLNDLQSIITESRTVWAKLDLCAGSFPSQDENSGADVKEWLAVLLVQAAGHNAFVSRIDSLIAAIRALGQYGSFEICAIAPNIVLRLSMLYPKIESCPLVKSLMETNRLIIASKPKTYKEQAIAVLRTQSLPLHFTAIADMIRSSGYRPAVDTRQVHNALQRHSDIFAWQSQGTYGLVEQGYKRIDFAKNLVLAALEELGHPASRQIIKAETLRSNPKINANSIAMYLDFDTAFYRSIVGTYGLREWLPPPHLQTARTDPNLVESPKSKGRLTR